MSPDGSPRPCQDKAQLLHALEAHPQNWVLIHPLELSDNSNTSIIIDAMVMVQEQVVFKKQINYREDLGNGFVYYSSTFLSSNITKDNLTLYLASVTVKNCYCRSHTCQCFDKSAPVRS